MKRKKKKNITNNKSNDIRREQDAKFHNDAAAAAASANDNDVVVSVKNEWAEHKVAKEAHTHEKKFKSPFIYILFVLNFNSGDGGGLNVTRSGIHCERSTSQSWREKKMFIMKKKKRQTHTHTKVLIIKTRARKFWGKCDRSGKNSNRSGTKKKTTTNK